MEEENGGKIAECGESSITPPVNNSVGKRKTSAETVCAQ